MAESSLIQILLDVEASAATIISILFIMSLGTWGIMFVKWREHKTLRKSNESFNKSFSEINTFVEVKECCSKAVASPLKNITSDVVDEVKNFSKFVFATMFHRSSQDR